MNARLLLTLLCTLFLLRGARAQLAAPPADDRYTAFSNIPLQTPDSLLQGWRKADGLVAAFPYLKALMDFHGRTGASDSVIFYAGTLSRDIQMSGLDPLSKLRYSTEATLALAGAYQNKGLYEEAIRYYLSGITAAERLQDKKLLQLNRFGYATVLFLKKQYDKAIPIYNELLQLSKDSVLIYKTKLQLGKLYLTKAEPVLARSYFQDAALYFSSHQLSKEALTTQLFLGITAEQLKKTDSAFTLFNEVKNKALEGQYYDLYVEAGLHMGDILKANKDFVSAQVVLSMVYINAMEWGDLSSQSRVLNSLTEVNAALGDYENAYALMTQARQVSSEILKQQNQKEVHELEAKYQSAQKEKQLLVKDKELSHQKTIKYAILIGFLVLLVPIIALLYVYYQKLQTQSKLAVLTQQANEEKIRAMLNENELALLAASVSGQEAERKRIALELHDSIGGNLAALKMQLSLQQMANPELMERLDETYKQVRDLSHNLLPIKMESVGFTSLLDKYLKSFASKKTTTISLDVYPEAAVGELSTSIKVMLYTVIQELMTNTQKHAAASTVSVQITRLENAVSVLFEDNGKGFNPDRTPTGIGLSNIKERIKPFDGSLLIDSYPERGTVINIEIPLNNPTHAA